MEPKVGVAYDPLRDELFLAVKGHGAYLNGERIHVSTCASLNDAMVVSLVIPSLAIGKTPTKQFKMHLCQP